MNDEQPVTVTWLETCGFQRDGFYFRNKVDLLLTSSGFYLDSEAVGWMPMKTRGQVRRLCQALGVSLLEAHSEHV